MATKVHVKKKIPNYKTNICMTSFRYTLVYNTQKKNRKYSIKYSNRAYTDKLPCLCEQLGVYYVKHKP